MKSKVFATLVILILFGLALTMPLARPAAAQTSAPLDPYALLDAVNVYRQARGLYAFAVSPALMNGAQQHSVHQATIGISSHSGAGGTNVLQRAQAAGYGSGSNIQCVENLASGTGLNAEAVLQTWSNSESSNNLTSPSFTDAGVGVSAAPNGTVYYTLNLCLIEADQPAIGFAGTPAATVVSEGGVLLSTPMVDGSIFHIVQVGENLVVIAQAYSISLAELFALNNLTKDSAIYPEQKLLIRMANTATPTSYFTATPTAYTPEPTSTRRPTRTPTPLPSATVPAPTPTPIPQAPGWSTDQVGAWLINAIFLSLAAGILFVALGLVLRLRR